MRVRACMWRASVHCMHGHNWSISNALVLLSWRSRKFRSHEQTNKHWKTHAKCERSLPNDGNFILLVLLSFLLFLSSTTTTKTVEWQFAKHTKFICFFLVLSLFTWHCMALIWLSYTSIFASWKMCVCMSLSTPIGHTDFVLFVLMNMQTKTSSIIVGFFRNLICSFSLLVFSSLIDVKTSK